MINYNYQLVTIILLTSVGFGALSLSNAQATESEKILRYISDKQVIRIRSGLSDKDRIVTTASSGTELELLAEKGKYSQVRTKKGRTGWVLSTYLQKKPIARAKLKEVSKLLKQVKSDILQKDKAFNGLNSAHVQLRNKFQRLESDFVKSQQENKKLQVLASNPIKLTNENKRLSLKSQAMEENIKTLQAEMVDLRDDTNKQWFLNGAGVVLLGVLIGLLLPKLRQQRKSDWSSSYIKP